MSAAYLRKGKVKPGAEIAGCITLRNSSGGKLQIRPTDMLDEVDIRPQTLVFLTDLCGTFPEAAPDYPVLWASTEGRQAPFGSVIPMHAA